MVCRFPELYLQRRGKEKFPQTCPPPPEYEAEAGSLTSKHFGLGKTNKQQRESSERNLLKSVLFPERVFKIRKQKISVIADSTLQKFG